ncbi:hypothetical protein GCM10010149_68570 [Nonomuraea roseoviolacea subsp. roseoviolacea]
MEWAQIPIVQGGAVVVLFAVLWLVFTGRLVPRSTLDDVRADWDARVAEAAEDPEAWKQLYVAECQTHQLTRQAHAQKIGAALAVRAQPLLAAQPHLGRADARHRPANHLRPPHPRRSGTSRQRHLRHLRRAG